MCISVTRDGVVVGMVELPRGISLREGIFLSGIACY
jgi:hypothetical protein